MVKVSLFRCVIPSLTLFYFFFHSVSLATSNSSQIEDLFEPEWHPFSRKESSRHPSRAEAERNFSSGIVSTPLLAGQDNARGVLRPGNNVRPMVFGHSHNGTDLDIAFTRYAVEGNLDTTFNTTGKFTYDVSGGDDLVHSTKEMLNYATGRHGTFFVGRGGDANQVQWLVGSLRNDGRLDTSFFTSGARLGTYYTGAEILRGFYLDTVNGRTAITAGYGKYLGNYNFMVAAYVSNGFLDTTFNTTGYQVTQMSGSDNGALAVATITAGSSFLRSPILAGPVHNGVNWDFGVARYRTDGILDTTFNSTGMITFNMSTSDDKSYAISVVDAFTYVGGYAYDSVGADNDFAIARVKSDGKVDTLFNTTGKVITAFSGGGDDVVFSLLATSGGGVLAAGSTDNGGNIDIALARYLTNGVLDTSFHTDGKNTLDVFGQMDMVQGLFGATGFYYAGIRVAQSGNENFGVLRLETDGTLALSSNPSLSFGTSGVLIQDLLGGVDTVTELDYESSYSASTLRFTGNMGDDIFVTTNIGFGSKTLLDTSFFTRGVSRLDFGAVESASAIITDGNGNLVAGDNGADFLIARTTIAGALHSSFFNAPTGYMTVDFNGVDKAYSMNKSRFVVGQDSSTPPNFAVLRFLHVGGLDTTFATQGKTTFTPPTNTSLAKFVSEDAGPLMVGDDSQDIVAKRITSDGRVDTTFNTSGSRVYDFGGTETFGGASSTVSWYIVGGDGSDFLVFRIRTNGSLDTSFNTTGRMNIDFGGANEKAKGVGVGTGNSGLLYVVGDNGTGFLIARFTVSGVLDTSFNTTGKRVYPLSGASTLNAFFVETERVCLYGSSNGNTDIAGLCVNP